MPRIEYTNDETRALEEAQGSDGRINVSSRADGRGYYNSRDKSESYSLLYNDANASINDFVVYLKNAKTDGKHIVIRSVQVNSEVLSKFSFVTVTGVAGGGTARTAVNLNQAGVARDATITALATADSSSTPMSNLTADKEIDHIQVAAGGYGEFKFQDQLRLGQGQAVAIRMDAGTADSQVFGVIYFYFE